ncbi:integration host factor subunit beta [Wolbachia endosymbiont of Litomosoides brasiliensis]|uniref:HU family DNA-binding protein n=1 Tax=Wolbachia endosymbiont of Litomosoides brasiliensis TaxID=1812117 RepID=UPI00158BF2E2|nr:HU family DNA-binding protein [Wolbachia endosymbiont of Litomosoides brasiliensis]NUY39844.1 integration host factor subunit beta [Wolbachia endosymbiont of Litomosoides brasiliensis]
MATKSNIITKVAKRYPLLERVVIAAIVNRFFEILSSTLERHNRVEIRGFGSFSIRSYNLKETSHSILQKFAKNQYFKTYFRSSKKLSDLINE